MLNFYGFHDVENQSTGRRSLHRFSVSDMVTTSILKIPKCPVHRFSRSWSVQSIDFHIMKCSVHRFSNHEVFSPSIFKITECSVHRFLESCWSNRSIEMVKLVGIWNCETRSIEMVKPCGFCKTWWNFKEVNWWNLVHVASQIFCALISLFKVLGPIYRPSC